MRLIKIIKKFGNITIIMDGIFCSVIDYIRQDRDDIWKGKINLHRMEGCISGIFEPSRKYTNGITVILPAPGSPALEDWAKLLSNKSDKNRLSNFINILKCNVIRHKFSSTDDASPSTVSNKADEEFSGVTKSKNTLTIGSLTAKYEDIMDLDRNVTVWLSQSYLKPGQGQAVSRGRATEAKPSKKGGYFRGGSDKNFGGSITGSHDPRSMFFGGSDYDNVREYVFLFLGLRAIEIAVEKTGHGESYNNTHSYSGRGEVRDEYTNYYNIYSAAVKNGGNNNNQFNNSFYGGNSEHDYRSMFTGGYSGGSHSKQDIIASIYRGFSIDFYILVDKKIGLLDDNQVNKLKSEISQGTIMAQTGPIELTKFNSKQAARDALTRYRSSVLQTAGLTSLPDITFNSRDINGISLINELRDVHESYWNANSTIHSYYPSDAKFRLINEYRVLFESLIKNSEKNSTNYYMFIIMLHRLCGILSLSGDENACESATMLSVDSLNHLGGTFGDASGFIAAISGPWIKDVTTLQF